MDSSEASRMVRLAIAFEMALGVAAVGIGWVVGHWPWVGVDLAGEHARGQVAAVGWGLVATGPLLVALFVCDRVPIGPLRGLRELTAEVITRMFRGATATQLGAVALAAGCGEELLFRGIVQSGLARLASDWPGQVGAILAASVIFGLCHWLNVTYAVLAMLAGAYFGLLLVLSGNILTPITAHAAYDFLALVYLIRPGSLLRSE